jgi:hypothetical protein
MPDWGRTLNQRSLSRPRVVSLVVGNPGTAPLSSPGRVSGHQSLAVTPTRNWKASIQMC